jgi:hypothetical protein
VRLAAEAEANAPRWAACGTRRLEEEKTEADALRKKIETELRADDLRERVLRERRKQGDA